MNFKLPVIGWLLSGLLVGILTAFYFPVAISFWFLFGLAILLIVSSLSWFSAHRIFSKLSLIASLTFFVALGFFLVDHADSRNSDNYFANFSSEAISEFIVHLEEEPIEKENSYKCLASVESIQGRACTGDILLYFDKSEKSKALKLGDEIQLKTHINPIRSSLNPNTFDYQHYLRIHDVHHQAYVKSESWSLLSNRLDPFTFAIHKVKDYCLQAIDDSGMSPENTGVAKALILGSKDSLDQATREAYAGAGAMHVLAVSGLHVGILMLILSFLFYPLKRIKNGKLFFLISIIVGIWLYAVLTGMSPSVLRASVMFSFIVIGKEMQRDNSIYQSILVSAFILLLFDPLVIFQVGFQLSYLAVLGIVYLQPKISNWFYIDNWLLNKIWQLSAVSIAAQLATFPLGLFYFHQFPNYFMLSNLLVIPMAFVILVVGITYITFSFVPVVNAILSSILDFFISLMNLGIHWIDTLPGAVSSGFFVYWFEVLVIYTAILIMVSKRFIKKPILIMAVMSLLLVWGSIRMQHELNVQHKDELVIYALNEGFAADVFEEGKHVFIAEKEIQADKKAIDFNIKGNWNYHTGKDFPDESILLSKENNYINLGTKSCFLLSDKNLILVSENGIPKCDLIYLTNLSFIPKETLNMIEGSEAILILGADVGYGLKSFLKKNLNADRIHDLLRNGAYTSIL